MPSFTVAIPSYRRPETVARKTLRLLTERGVPASCIDVWVADEAERQSYAATVPASLYGQLRVSAPTLCASRNHMARAYLPGTRVLYCDDDLDDLIVRLNEKETEPLRDIAAFTEECFTTAESIGCHLWGIYPVKNPYFMKQRVRTDLCYIEGAFYGVTQRWDPCELVSLEDKEDFERTLKFYRRDGLVARFEWVAMVTKFYTEPGGMQETRTEERITDSAKFLANNYPNLCTFYVSKKGHGELRLRDRRKP